MKRRTFLKSVAAIAAAPVVPSIPTLDVRTMIWPAPRHAMSGLAASFLQTKEMMAARALNNMYAVLAPGVEKIFEDAYSRIGIEGQVTTRYERQDG